MVELVEVVKPNLNTYLNTPKTGKTVGALQLVDAFKPIEAVQLIAAVELIEVVKHNSNTYLNTPRLLRLHIRAGAYRGARYVAYLAIIWS